MVTLPERLGPFKHHFYSIPFRTARNHVTTILLHTFLEGTKPLDAILYRMHLYGAMASIRCGGYVFHYLGVIWLLKNFIVFLSCLIFVLGAFFENVFSPKGWQKKLPKL